MQQHAAGAAAIVDLPTSLLFAAGGGESMQQHAGGAAAIADLPTSLLLAAGDGDDGKTQVYNHVYGERYM